MRFIFLLIFFTITSNFQILGQNQLRTSIVVGEKYALQPESLSGEWDIEVALPESYENSNVSYPVVYALHGDFYFKYAVGGFQRLMEFGDIPEVIIVGISNESNAYFAYGSEGADRFLRFMEKDIFPLIERNYRTHPDRTILGWHYTSGFIFHVLSNRPELFKNYVPISPYLGGYDVSKIEFSSLEKLNLDQPTVRKILYFGALSNERSVTEASLSLDSLLKHQAPGNLDWSFRLIEPDYDQGIGISVYRLWNPGLKTAYQNYKAEELGNRNIEVYLSQGGLKYVQQHYEGRAAKYGGTAKIPELFSLVIGAMRADEFQAFDELFQLMKGNLAGYNLNRLLGFAAYYSNNDKHEEALEIYDEINGFYPNSISVYEGMALAYIASGESEKAIDSYDQAIELARAQSDDRLDDLEKARTQLR